MTLKKLFCLTATFSNSLGRARFYFFALLTSLLSGQLHAQPVLEVYETYWPANKIAPLIQDVLGPGDTISVYRNKIIVRTDRANHQEIRRVLDEVDHPPRNLLISLRKSDQHQVSSQGVEAGISYTEEDDGVRIRRGDSDNNVVVYRGSSTDGRVEMRVLPKGAVSTANEGSVQQIRVLEGEEGYISLGEETPVKEQVVTINGISSTTHYKPVTSGIYVVPTIQNKKVRLEINSHSQKIKGNNSQANIEVSSLNTVVSVPLGLWSPLGGVDQSVSQNNRGVTYSTRQQGRQDLGYEVKVDVIE